MKFSRKILILYLSLTSLSITTQVDKVLAQSLSPDQAEIDQRVGSPEMEKKFDLNVTKEKINDVTDSITVPTPYDVLNLDSVFYPTLNSNFGDMSGIDVLTFEKLKARFEPKIKKKRQREGIHLDDIPNIYEIDMSSMREASRGLINKVDIGKKSGNIVKVGLGKNPTNLNEDSKKAVEQLRKSLAYGDIDQAKSQLQRAAVTHKNDPWFLAELGSMYEDYKLYDKAAALYGKALSFSPNRIELMYSYAYNLYKDNKFDKSEKYMKKILSIDPKFTLAYYNLGNIYFKKGRYIDALNAFNESIKLNPMSADTYYNVALILEVIGQKDMAVKYYNKTIELNPSDMQAMNAINRIKNNKKP